MDVNRDLADPRQDMIKEETGKYIYVDPANGEFDIDKFNGHYEQYRDRRRNEMKKKMKEKLDELNAPTPTISVYEQSIPKILSDTKESVFNTLDDLLQGSFKIDTFTKDNRLFFIGITLIFMALFVYIYSVLVGDNQEKYNNSEQNKFYVQHTHNIVNNQNLEYYCQPSIH